MMRRQAFTLIELVITVGVLSALAIVGFSSFGGFRERQILESEASKVESVLNKTRQKAIGEEESVAWGIRFDNPASGIDYLVSFAGADFGSGAQREKISLPSGVEWLKPATGETTDVQFSKGKGLLNADTIVDMATITGSGSYRFVITTLGRVNKIKHGYGLQGYWNMDDPSGVTTGRDQSGLGNSLSLTNITVAQTGQVARAFSFNGTSSYATAPTATTLNIASTTSAFTISAWFKTSAVGTQYIIDNYDASTENLSLRMNAGKIETYLAGASGSNGTPQYGSGYNDNNWHQVVWVWDGISTESVYVDGDLVNTSTGISLTGSLESGSALRIGARPTSTTYWDGLLDEVRVWNRALTEQQIRDIYRTDLAG